MGTCYRNHVCPQRRLHFKSVCTQDPLTSIALVNILVSLNGIFSGNFSLVIATYMVIKEKAKSMVRFWPLAKARGRWAASLIACTD